MKSIYKKIVIRKGVIYFISMVLLIGCNVCDKPSFTINSIEIPSNTQNITSLKYQNSTSEWFYNGDLFSGFIVEYYENNALKLKMSIYQGKRHNKTEKWFPNGELMEVSYYDNGKLNGEKKVWAQNSEHTLVSQFNFRSGKAHGEQRNWYPSGELYKITNYDDGIESGIQKAYRKNGALYANYEARNGRIYGLKKSKLCYGLEDEQIIGISK